MLDFHLQFASMDFIHSLSLRGSRHKDHKPKPSFVLTAMQAGSRVQVLADLDGKCLRGFTQVYQGRKVYVGTGVTCVSREDLFCAESSILRSVWSGGHFELFSLPCFVYHTVTRSECNYFTSKEHASMDVQENSCGCKISPSSEWACSRGLKTARDKDMYVLYSIRNEEWRVECVENIFGIWKFKTGLHSNNWIYSNRFEEKRRLYTWE